MNFIKDMDEEMNNSLKNDFSNNVKSYLLLEEEITKLNIALRERRKKMKVLSEMIMRNMNNNNIQHINIKNGVLIYKNKESYKGLNKKTLINGLTIFFNKDEDKAIDAQQTIYANREKYNKTTLKLKKF
tara:strand:+ start:258 stop:644 length:387 start_codon:yes stop_codon:yes gene_type:complete